MTAKNSHPHLSSVLTLKVVALIAAFLMPALLYADWSGGLKKPSSIDKGGKTFYEIETAENLAWFALQVNNGYSDYNAILKKDVAIVDTAVTENTTPWIQIGNADSVSFKGVFDGNGHTISGIYTNTKNAGFFGVIGEGGVVKNLNLKNVLSQGDVGNKQTRAGLLSSVFSGDSIVNVSVAGTVSDTTYAGGLAAIITSKSYIERIKTDVTFIGYVVGTWNKNQKFYSRDQIVGGIAAVALDSLKILNSHVSISVSGSNTHGLAGGFIGVDSSYIYFENDTNSSNMISEVSTDINAMPYTYGGFVMRIAKKASADFVGCLNRGEISGTRENSGGFIGEGYGNVTFLNSVNEGTVKSNGASVPNAGGFIGEMHSASDKDTTLVSFEHCFNKGYVYSPENAGGFIGNAYKTKTTIFNSENAGIVKSGYAGGFISYPSGGSVYIENCKNTANIIGGSAAGFISYNNAKTIIDHSVNEGDISGGGTRLAGFIAVVIDDCPETYVRNSTNKGRISGRNIFSVGGIFASARKGYAVNCENYGDVVGDAAYSTNSSNVNYSAGGILGIYGTALNCSNYGNVVLSDTTSEAGGMYGAGGIAGFLGRVEHCYNKGTVTVTATNGDGYSPMYNLSGGISAQGSVLYSVNEGHVVMDIPEGVKAEKCFAAGISMGDGDVGGNINKGVVIVNGGAGKGYAYPSLGWYDGWFGSTPSKWSVNVVAGNLSFSDSIVNNGLLTSCSMLPNTKYPVSYCSFFNKDIYKVADDTVGLGISTAEMQTEEFAWRLNTCNGKVNNNGFWSQHGTNNPVWADDENHAIYKVSFWDSSKVINVNKFKVGESLTNYKGVIIKMPEPPDPSDADDDLKFGYWSYGKNVIDKSTIINGDYSVYANHVNKKVNVETLDLKTETGDIVARYAIADEGFEVILPEGPSKMGYEFLGWYNGNQLIAGAGDTIVSGNIRTLTAKYEMILYKITFMNGPDTLQTENLAYGKQPQYKGSNPVCHDAGYKFAGWIPSVATVTADASYYAYCENTNSSSSSSVAVSSSSVTSSSSVNSSSSVASSSSCSSAIGSSSSSSRHSGQETESSSSRNDANSSSSTTVTSSSSANSSSSVASSSSTAKSSSSVASSSSCSSAIGSSSSSSRHSGQDTESSSSRNDANSSSSTTVTSSSTAKTSSSSAKSSSSSVKSSSSKAKSSSSKNSDFVWNVSQSKFSFAVEGMTITLSNVQSGTVRIFDALGHLVVLKPVSASGLTSITLQTPGNYVVRVNGEVRQVSVR